MRHRRSRPEPALLETTMNKADDVLAKVREICLTLPDTKETPTWGKPHFRVGDKIFAGCDDTGGCPSLGFKLEMAHQARVLRDKRFTKAPYVGHKGWVTMDASNVRDWEEVRALVLESYRLIASKKSLAKLMGGAATTARRAVASSPRAPKESKRAAAKPGARRVRERESFTLSTSAPARARRSKHAESS
jgi:predicted DNA-binding protein (MmcQ/YjbR family)